MTDPPDPGFASVVAEYRRLEPDGTDTWNPLLSERELLHRLVLYERLCLALARGERDLADIRVLDVGCGNGRSTRVYLDFGIRPEQLTGIDLRPAAVDMARRSHPGIRFLAYDGITLPLEAESVDWVSVCTVMSSIPGIERRRYLADEIVRVLAPGGNVFCWDRAVAKRFAGGDAVIPMGLFPGLDIVTDEPVRVQGRLDRLFPGPTLRRLLLPVLRRLAPPKTHRVVLLRKPEALA
jgi:SAM-dependent methyltransferase